MAALSSKVHTRLVSGLKRYQAILEAAKARDVNEADTVTIVKDILGDVFGYDKYAEVTSEYAIRGTYVDLALKLDGKLYLLVEVKAIGQEIEDRHAKQAVDYGANQGVEWVALTNGVTWRVYRITFGKPIGQELVMSLDLLGISTRNMGDLQSLFPLTKEGLNKSALQEHHEQRQATNKFILGALLQTDALLEVLRREVRRLSPNVRVSVDELRLLLAQDVLKREIVEGEKATEASHKVRRAASRRLRAVAPEDLVPPSVKAPDPVKPG